MFLCPWRQNNSDTWWNLTSLSLETIDSSVDKCITEVTFAIASWNQNIHFVRSPSNYPSIWRTASWAFSEWHVFSQWKPFSRKENLPQIWLFARYFGFCHPFERKNIICAFQPPETKFWSKNFFLRNWKLWDKPHILLTITIPFERQN